MIEKLKEFKIIFQKHSDFRLYASEHIIESTDLDNEVKFDSFK